MEELIERKMRNAEVTLTWTREISKNGSEKTTD